MEYQNNYDQDTVRLSSFSVKYNIPRRVYQKFVNDEAMNISDSENKSV